MKIITLTEQEFDNYAIRVHNQSTHQSSAYGQLMQKHGFMAHYIGLVDNNQVIHAASLIIYKKIFLFYKFAYAPRGFLIDYHNNDLLKLFTIKLKRLLRKQGFLFIKIDPLVIYQTLDKNGQVISPPDNSTVTTLKKLGYIHQGYTNYFETLKPRTNAILKWSSSSANLFATLPKKMQASIKKAIKKGITVHKGSRQDIELLYKMIKNKQPRRNLNYYLDYYDIYKAKNMIDIYYAKLNPTILLDHLRTLYSEENEHNLSLIKLLQETKEEDIVSKKMKSDEILNIHKQNIIQATEIFKQYPNGVIVASSLVINYNKCLYFSLDGFNIKYKKYNPNHLLRWLVISEYLKHGYTKMNLNGISSDLHPKNKYHGLNQFKLGFNAHITEFIGEFDLPLNIVPYFIFTKLNKLFLATIKKS